MRGNVIKDETFSPLSSKMNDQPTNFNSEWSSTVFSFSSWVMAKNGRTGCDGNWVSLRVNSHLRPSTLQGSLVGRIAPTTEVSGGVSLCHHLDGGQYLYLKVYTANTIFCFWILWVILVFYFSGLLQKLDWFSFGRDPSQNYPLTSSELIHWCQSLI
jgi:hypothetical protein